MAEYAEAKLALVNTIQATAAKDHQFRVADDDDDDSATTTSRHSNADSSHVRNQTHNSSAAGSKTDRNFRCNSGRHRENPVHHLAPGNPTSQRENRCGARLAGKQCEGVPRDGRSPLGTINQQSSNLIVFGHRALPLLPSERYERHCGYLGK